MKQVIAAIAVLLALVAPAFAESPAEVASPVTAIIRSTSTFSPVTIASHTATNVADNSVTPKYRWVVVENEEATASIYCSERSNTGVSGSTRGSKILATKYKLFTLKYDASLYCRCDASGATCAGFLLRYK